MTKAGQKRKGLKILLYVLLGIVAAVALAVGIYIYRSIIGKQTLKEQSRPILPKSKQPCRTVL